MKKLLLILLTALIIASSAIMASCADTGDINSGETDTDPVTAAETRIEPDLPDINYNGEKVRFYSWNIDGWRTWEDIAVEATNGDLINDTVYNRNLKIEDTYGVSIEYSYDQYLTYEANVRTTVNAGEDAYDVLLSMGHDIPRLYTGNVFYNLYNVDYLDFEKPWWDQNAVESFTLAGYMPFTVSDMLLLDKGATSVTYFNKSIAVDFNLGNIYQYVYDNEWTIDTMIRLGKSVSDDTDGNNLYDDQDRYGIVGSDEPVFILFAGGGGRHISKDEQGYPVISFNSEENFSLIRYFLESVMYDETLTRNETYSGGKSASDMFMEDQGLFMMTSLSVTPRLRSMENDFGILPVPKWKAEQESYGCAVAVFGNNLISVPITATKNECIGVILEAMAAESYYTLRPALYDTVLKDKLTRDEESTDMLDIIISSRVYDVGDYYGLASFPDQFLRITGSCVAQGMSERTSDIASFYAARERGLTKAVSDLVDIIDDWRALDLD